MRVASHKSSGTWWRAADRAAGHCTDSPNERERLQRHRRGWDTHEAQGSGGTKSLNVDVPILISIGGIQDEVERAGYFFHGFRFARMNEVMSTQGACFFFLLSGSGESDDLCSEDAGELNGDVSEAADTDDTDARRGINAVVA